MRGKQRERRKYGQKDRGGKKWIDDREGNVSKCPEVPLKGVICYHFLSLFIYDKEHCLYIIESVFGQNK